MRNCSGFDCFFKILFLVIALLLIVFGLKYVLVAIGAPMFIYWIIIGLFFIFAGWFIGKMAGWWR